MASIKAIFFCVAVFAALFAFSAAEERVKKDVIYAGGLYPYAGYPYPVVRSYPYALSYADDGSYFPGKYDPYY